MIYANYTHKQFSTIKMDHTQKLFPLILILPIFCFSCISSKLTYDDVRGRHLMIENGNKKLFWFHQIHSNDPKSLMFDDIRNEIKNFNPNFILVEGGFNSTNYDSANDAKLAGESAYTSFLANEFHIPCGNIEPLDIDINNYLLQSFSTEQILAMYILRQMNQKQREAKNIRIEFNDYFLGFMNSMIQTGLSYSITDSNNISMIIEPYVGYRVDQNNWLNVNTFDILHNRSSIISKIYQETINFRNIHVLKAIEYTFIESDRIFIMMGFDHADELKDELYKLIIEVR